SVRHIFKPISYLEIQLLSGVSGGYIKVSEKFRYLANHWKDTKPNVAIMIEALAKSYEYEAQMHDEDGLWNQES
ncbi:hypothetical protein MRO53_24415, partial [Escherichia coli]|nr:hypothetical protein [Escherichia coli]